MANDPLFYTKRGLLTKYSFTCGYVEKLHGCSLYMEHGTYQVRGFREGQPKGVTYDGNRDVTPVMPDVKPFGNYHIVGSFSHVKEARKFMTKPFTHIPSREGSVMLTKVNV